ncbi:MAG: hypothetical protein LBS18_04775 [Clostridiales bacterium]|jgi:hypothetical protein|nr:hypothetical protein [Clostridiales bacterium]
MTEAMINMIQNDIYRCAKASNTRAGSKRMYEAMIARYNTLFIGFGDVIPTGPKTHYPDGELDYCNELNCIKEKLELVLIAGMDPDALFDDDDDAEKDDIIINISFDDVRAYVDGMSALTQSQIEEIHEKIDTLEEITNADMSRPQKWEEARHIIAWAADWGVDVGVGLLALLLKMSA